jgi:iron(III) transport system substrate-binding protein
VAKGEFAVGMTMEYAAQEYVAGGQKDIQIVYPTEGTVHRARGHGAREESPNPTEARKFYDFLASKETQEMLFKKFYRRPVRDDIDTTKVGLPPTTQFKVKPIDDAKATAAQAEFLKMWKDLVAKK